MAANATTELGSLLASLNIAVSALQEAMSTQNLPPFSRGDLSAHPLDVHTPDPLIWYARKAITGFCYEMIALVQNPHEKGATDTLSFLTGAALTVISQGKPSLADIIWEAGPDGIEIAELARKSGKDNIKLRSLFRLLISTGYVREVSFGRVAPTRLTAAVLSEHTVAGLLGSVIATPCYQAAAALQDTISLPAALGQQTAFEAAHGESVFQYLQARPKDLLAFQRGMTAIENRLDSGLVSDYPWKDLGPEITFVDVGAGNGAVTMQLLLDNPGWKAIILDTEYTIPLAREFWESNAPALIESQRVDFLAHDIMKEIPLRPAPEGLPYVFMVKNVLHDWPDDASLQIVQNLSPATNSKSILLIVNFTPQISQPQASSISVAESLSKIKGRSMHAINSMNLPFPAGLEAGWGFGNSLISSMDSLMLTLFNGRDRTSRDFEELLQETC